MGPGKSYLRIAKKMATNLKNGVFWVWQRAAGAGAAAEGPADPFPVVLGPPRTAFPGQPSPEKHRRTGARGPALRPTGGPSMQTGFLRLPRCAGPLAPASRALRGRKTGEKQAQNRPAEGPNGPPAMRGGSNAQARLRPRPCTWSTAAAAARAPCRTPRCRTRARRRGPRARRLRQTVCSFCLFGERLPPGRGRERANE